MSPPQPSSIFSTFRPYSTPSIPAEVVDLFVEQLDASISRRSESEVNWFLAPLLSVSRTFRYSARKRIFREVVLWYNHAPVERQAATILYDVLKGDPAIQRCIKELTIVFDRDNLEEARERPNPPADFDDDRVNCPDFIALLHLFSKAPITRVLIESRHTRYLHVNRFGPSGMEALMALRCNPHIVSFSFEELDRVPSMLITGIPSTDTLSTLRLYDVDVLGSGSKVATYPFTAAGSTDEPPFVQKILGSPQQFPFQNLRVLVVDNPSEFPFGLCRSLEEADAGVNVPWITVDPVPEKRKPPSPNFVFRYLEVLAVGNTQNQDDFDWYPRDTDHLAIAEIVKRAPKLHTLDLVSSPTLGNDLAFSSVQCNFLQYAHEPLGLRISDVLGDYSRQKTVTGAARLITANLPLDKVSTFYLRVVWDCPNEAQLHAVLEPSRGWHALFDALRKVPSLRKVTLDLGFWTSSALYKPISQAVRRETKEVLEENLSRLGNDVEVEIMVEFSTNPFYPFSYTVPEDC